MSPKLARDILQVAGTILGLVLMLFSIAWLKPALNGDWIAIGLFNLCFWAGLASMGFYVVSPMIDDFFQRGLGKVWLNQIEESEQDGHAA